MMEKIDLASTEEQGVEDIPNNVPNKQNICMMTQKLLKMFLVLPKPKVLSMASTIMHGTGQTANMEEGVLVEVVGHKQYHAEAEPSPQREGYGGDGQGYLRLLVCGA